MGRAIITISESGKVNIPSGNVWMSEMELVELFGVIAPTPEPLSERYTRVEHYPLQQLNDAILQRPKVGLHSIILK